MTLNKQLLCVSLLLLSLPWAGCQYLREIDATLRQSQQQTLEATATVIAQSLAINPKQLDPHGEIVETPEPGTDKNAAIYCYPLPAPIRADGYFEEWDENGAAIPWSRYQTQDNQHQVHYRCGIHEDHLALSFTIEDTDIIYNNPTRSLVDHGDRLILNTGSRTYILTAVAPGSITTRYRLNPHTTYRESSIEASWIDNERGYQIEINCPLTLIKQQLSFEVVDESASGSIRFGPAQKTTVTPRFIYQAKQPRQQLNTFQQQGLRLHLVNTEGLLLASVGDPTPEQTPSAHWLLRKLYRAILDDSQAALTLNDRKIDFSDRAEFQPARRGQHSSQWYKQATTSSYQLLSSAVPIFNQEQVIAVLFAEQSSERTAALTDRAFTHLFGLSLGIIVTAVMVLLSYASWLSWRIRCLSKATQQALDEQGNVQLTLPASHSKDEIGALYRHYAELMKRIGNYTEYLQTLSRKLSHELRTPLAIIHSSLDNLAQQSLDHTTRTYQQRAKEGANRLGTILTAMSEARRVEESIAQAEPEPVNLSALLQELTSAYQDIYPQQRVTLSGIETDTPAIWLSVVPDLIVQALDKLMENAASYCPPGGSISLGIESRGPELLLSVENDGPLLPETMHNQLFDQLVSLREVDDDEVHLGLGLYIVSLIAQYHHGSVSARNNQSRTGVIFQINLPVNLEEKFTSH